MLNIKIFSKPMQAYIDGEAEDTLMNITVRSVNHVQIRDKHCIRALVIDAPMIDDGSTGVNTYFCLDSIMEGDHDIEGLLMNSRMHSSESSDVLHSFYITDNSGKTVYYEE